MDTHLWKTCDTFGTSCTEPPTAPNPRPFRMESPTSYAVVLSLLSMFFFWNARPQGFEMLAYPHLFPPLWIISFLLCVEHQQSSWNSERFFRPHQKTTTKNPRTKVLLLHISVQRCALRHINRLHRDVMPQPLKNMDDVPWSAATFDDMFHLFPIHFCWHDSISPPKKLFTPFGWVFSHSPFSAN